MGFILGLLLGLLGTIVLWFLLLWVLIGRLNKEATAKVLQTAAAVLQNKVEVKKEDKKEPVGFKR